MRLLLILIAFLSMVGCNNTNQRVIKDSIESKLEKYPESTLKDLYKSYFQDYFGPGHMIGDTAAAMNYLEYELGMHDYTDTVLLDPTGYEGNFYRVNLVLIKNNVIPKDEFFKYFIESVNSVEGISIEAWKNKWAMIFDQILPYSELLPGFEEDREYIDSLLRNDDYVVHHSERYLNAYHPHYRIIHEDIFEKHLSEYLSGN